MINKISKTLRTLVLGFAFVNSSNVIAQTISTSNATPCINSVVTYTASGVNGNPTYNWTIPSGATAPSLTGSSITVTYNSNLSGTVDVSAGNNKNASMIVNVGPVKPTVIYGSSSPVLNTTGNVYYVDSVANHTYTWSVSGATITSGQNKGRILLTMPNSSGTATLSVVASSCNAFASSTSKTLTIGTVSYSSSNSSGDINTTSTWQNNTAITSSSNVEISANATITVKKNTTITRIANLIVQPGATLSLSDDFEVTGSLVLNGTINTNGNTLTLSGSSISGTGSFTGSKGNTTTVNISNTNTIQTGSNITVEGVFSAATLTNNGTLTLNDKATFSSTLTNSGTITFSGATTLASATNSGTLTFGSTVAGTSLTNSGTTTITGNSTLTTLTNSANATINLGGSVSAITATASGNTVNYNGSSQTIFAGTYQHFKITGTGAAFTAGSSYIIQGNFTATNTFTSPNSISFTGSNAQILTTVTNQSFKSVFFNKSINDLILNSDISLSGTLTFSGSSTKDIDLYGHTISLGTTGTLSGENNNSRIKASTGLGAITAQGTVMQSAAPLNIGNLGASFADSSVAVGSVTVSRSHKSYGAGKYATPSRSYDIVVPTGVNGNMNLALTLAYFPKERTDGAETTQKLYQSTDGVTFDTIRTNSGSRRIVDSISTSFNTVKITKVKSFTRTVAGGKSSPSTPLPVEISKFSAYRSLNNVVVNWTTAMELNNKEFVLETSLDGSNFESYKTIAGNGTTNNLTKYNLTILNAIESNLFIRLKQVDFDGKTAYSKIIVVSPISNSNLDLSSGFSIFPNPVSTDEIFLKFDNSIKQSVIVKIFDATEKMHYSEQIDVEGTGVTKLFLIPSQYLTKGVYFLTIQTVDKLETMKLVIE